MTELFQVIFGLFQRGRKDGRPARACPVQRREPLRTPLTLEVLEDRTLLAAWSPIGPAPQLDPNNILQNLTPEAVSGRVSAMAISSNYDGANNPALFVGTASGGIWRSTNAFTSANPTWTPETDAVQGAGALHIGAIAVDPNNPQPKNPQIMYAGTGEANYPGTSDFGDTEYGNGILKSTTGGNTWQLISQGPGGVFSRRSISSLFVDPTNSNNLYAAVVQSGPNSLGSLGIFKSIDGGANWQQIAGQDAEHIGAGITVTSLDYNRTDANHITIYAGVMNYGIYRSTDDGVTWTQLGTGTPIVGAGAPSGAQVGRISLAADHHLGATLVYAAVANYSPSTLMNVYKSTDGGNNWKPLTTPPNFTGNIASYTLAIGLSPEGRLYLGGLSQPTASPPVYGYYESNVGGTVWHAIDVGNNKIIPHTDAHAWAFMPDGTVYSGNDGGVWRYDPAPFDPATTLTAGNGPNALTAGDFNGDGKQDLAVVNYSDNTVSYLQGNGDGTFQPAGAAIPVGKGPAAIAVGKFDAGNTLDLAVANFTDNTVTILLGNGNGGFVTKQTIGLHDPVHDTDGVNPIAIVAGDFNNDGKIDLAVADKGSNNVSVLLGNGDGTFQPAVNYAVGTSPTSLVADVFDPTAPAIDLAVANYGSSNVSVLLNNGNGSFANAVTYAAPSGGGPISIVSGDFNNDGAIDLVTANYNTGNVSVFDGNGDGTFANLVNYAAGDRPFRLAVADFNGDRNEDLAVALDNSNKITELLGNGAGAFPNIVNPFPVLASNQTPSGLVTADFNNDNHPDLALVSSKGVSVALNTLPSISPQTAGNWDDLNIQNDTTKALQTNQLNAIALDPTNKQKMLEGSHDNGTALTTDGGTNWNTVGTNDGGMVRFDPGDPNYAYKVTQNGNFSVSKDGGATWSPSVVTEKDAFPFYSVFAIDPAKNGRLMLGSNLFVWKSLDNGKTWQQASTRLNTTAITALAYAPSNGNILYVGGKNGSVYRTDWAYNGTDPGNWKLQYGGTAWKRNPITSIVVDPNTPTTAYLAVSAFGVPQIWYTKNGGFGWKSIDTGLPDVPVNSLALDKSGANPILYAGTDAGVYRGIFKDGAWSWAPFGDSLPNVQVKDLQLQAYGATKILAAATYGRGAWKITIPPPPRVQGMGPDQGFTSGGTAVAITGTGFTGATGVYFGSVAASSFTINSDTSITAVAPAEAAGNVDVTVANALDTSATSSADQFLYVSSITSLQSSANAALPGQAVTLTATVTGSTSGVPTGTVTFDDGSTQLANVTLSSNGTASYTTTALSLGSHALTAIYNGDSTFPTSNASLTEVVSQETNDSVSLVSSANPATQNQSVTFTTTVSGGSGTPTGTVTFLDGSTLLDTATLDGTGTATFTISTLPPASQAITANYSGDATYNSGSAALTETVNSPVTVMSLSSNANPATPGASVTLTADVTVQQSANTPTGSVTFYDGATQLGVVTLGANGTAAFTTTTLGLGSHAISAQYSGDSNFNSNTASLTQGISQEAPASLSLSSSVNPSTANEDITFTAVVSGGGSVPTGTVTFLDGNTLLRTATLDFTGTATLTTSTLSLGSHTITAVYGGDATYNTVSAALTQTVNQDTTSTTLTSDTNPALPGQPVTLTATVSTTQSGTPTGTVTFFDGGTTLGTTVLDASDNAMLTTSALALADHAITAVYSGDANYLGSSGSLTQVISQETGSSMSLTSSLNPALSTQAVTLTATVSGGNGTPSGTVTFMDENLLLGTATLDSTGTATFTTSSLLPDTQTITANYSGDVTYNSNSASLTQTVNSPVTLTSLSSNVNPALPGTPVTLTANVSAQDSTYTPTGSVTFYDGSTALDTVTLDGNGNAVFTTSALAAGSHALSAQYSGDSNFTTSSGSLTQVISQETNNFVSLSSSASSTTLNQPVTFTATVSGSSGTPTGTVTFMDGDTTLGSATLNSSGTATFTTSDLTLGSQTIAAIYSGDATYGSNTASLTQTISQAVTMMSVNASVNPAQPGQQITFAANLYTSGSSLPTGTVTFLDGSTILGSSTLVPGSGESQATFTTSTLANGSHTITAVYSGDDTFAPNSSSFNETVGSSSGASSQIYLSTSVNPAVPGQSVTFTANVAGGNGPATGTVTFLDGSTVLGTASVGTNGQAVFTTSDLVLGDNDIVAIYSGDSTYAPSAMSQTQQVVPASTSIYLSASANPAPVGQPVTFTATLGSGYSGVTPTGTVSFYDGTTLLGTATLTVVNGQVQASFTTAAMGLGTHSILAVYSGDDTFANSATSLPENITS